MIAKLGSWICFADNELTLVLMKESLVMLCEVKGLGGGVATKGWRPTAGPEWAGDAICSQLLSSRAALNLAVALWHSPSTFKAGAAHCLLWTIFRKDKAAGWRQTAALGRGPGSQAQTCEQHIFPWVLIVNVHFLTIGSQLLLALKDYKFPSWWQIVQLHLQRHKTSSSSLRIRSIDFQL